MNNKQRKGRERRKSYEKKRNINNCSNTKSGELQQPYCEPEKVKPSRGVKALQHDLQFLQMITKNKPRFIPLKVWTWISKIFIDMEQLNLRIGRVNKANNQKKKKKVLVTGQ